MLSLLELQREFRGAVLADDAGALTVLIDEHGLAPQERFGVYRNNVVASLTAALAETFPVVRRLVDERFFAYAAHEFICRQPPVRPCLAEYGADFPEFLAAFPPCRELAYLPDVARLEWLLHRAAHAAEADVIAADALRSVSAENTGHLVFQFVPSIAYLASAWPVDRIWRANIDGDDAAIDLAAGGAHLEVRRRDGDVELCRMSPGDFAFRSALQAGRPLGAAAAAALAVDAAFDLSAAFARLFQDGAIASFDLTDEDSSR
jgi:hypothetical protein